MEFVASRIKVTETASLPHERMLPKPLKSANAKTGLVLRHGPQKLVKQVVDMHPKLNQIEVTIGFP